MKKWLMFLMAGIIIFGNCSLFAFSPNLFKVIVMNDTDSEISIDARGLMYAAYDNREGKRECENICIEGKYELKPHTPGSFFAASNEHKVDYYKWKMDDYIRFSINNKTSNLLNYFKLSSCNSWLWDYYNNHKDDKSKDLKILIWDNGYRRTDYDGRWIGANYGEDTSDIEWENFANINGNNNVITREGVVVIWIIDKDSNKLPNNDLVKYSAGFHTITLPKFAEKFFQGKPGNDNFNKKSPEYIDIAQSLEI